MEMALGIDLKIILIEILEYVTIRRIDISNVTKKLINYKLTIINI